MNATKNELQHNTMLHYYLGTTVNGAKPLHIRSRQSAVDCCNACYGLAGIQCAGYAGNRVNGQHRPSDDCATKH